MCIAYTTLYYIVHSLSVDSIEYMWWFVFRLGCSFCLSSSFGCMWFDCLFFSINFAHTQAIEIPTNSSSTSNNNKNSSSLVERAVRLWNLCCCTPYVRVRACLCMCECFFALWRVRNFRNFTFYLIVFLLCFRPLGLFADELKLTHIHTLKL